jgi:hypothetical protein
MDEFIFAIEGNDVEILELRDKVQMSHSGEISTQLLDNIKLR